ncbi:hypothetical protein C5167_049079 [Papaver somniferum]|uniref:Uncharacterized protein n=1 Tax=Papaver somniferum TaxID=3469 RepID=A0A4Y7KNC8_PAPSO|nr:uncharacterized protein LOC113306963 [Papaver somniferum]XP_026411669.1 uncharacterized protein LOC113306963 [Papaver somniferum]XP_026411670.1 uncharacterized protein LOC113306963 [Papaver somniferum]RZC73598.1 hypothetical protein C5167_049079 [Papaver somniferum]
MGLDTELDFEKYCKVVEVPKHGGPSRRRKGRNVDNRDERGKPTARSSLSRLGGNLSDISFNKSLSSSCKVKSSGASMLSGNEASKRGSVYQSSTEVRRLKNMGSVQVREKIELSCRNDTTSSFKIIESLTHPNEEAKSPVEEKSSPVSCYNRDSNPNSMTVTKPNNISSLQPGLLCVSAGDVSSDGFCETLMDSDDRKHISGAESAIRGSTDRKSFKCGRTADPLKDGKSSLENNTVFSLHKSSSEKLGMPYYSSTNRLESDRCSKADPKARFSHFRRMLDPFMKSKSLRSPSVYVPHASEEVSTIKRSKTICKSLLSDFSNTAHELETSSLFVDHCMGTAYSSPAHLHGQLKLEHKHGIPFFEFSLKDPEEDVLAAKPRRADSTSNWVYTFHSVNNCKRKSSNRSPWGAKERQKDDSVVGQMQASSYLCSDLRENGDLDNSMMSEFVLYDIAHARKISRCCSSTDSSKPPAEVAKGSGTTCKTRSMVVDNHPDMSEEVLAPHEDPLNHRHEIRHSSGSVSDSGNPLTYPWALGDLLPNLEIAGIVIQVPFEKRESLKGGKQDDIACVGYSRNSLVFPGVNNRSNESLAPSTRRRSLANVTVVTPSGTHGLPSSEKGGAGPSPLLDRWRSSGGCDCGGWDMACPLLVLDSARVQNIAGGSGLRLMDDKWPLELFVQKSKEKIPALTIKAINDGQYAVDFHAQLSKLQAFSICVAILHSSDVSTTEVFGYEKDAKQRLHCNSLKVLLEEEVRFLIEAVAEGGKRKITKTKEEHPPSFLLNPPFSPIGRV